MDLGDRIKEARVKLGLNQEEMALKLGYKNKQSVSNWESNKQKPSHDVLVQIASLSGLSLEYLITGHKTIIEESNVIRVNGAFFKVVRSINAGDPEYIFSEVNYTGEDIWFPYEKTERCFSLVVNGDSMTSPIGKSINEGDYVLVDMDLDVINGDVVVVSLVNGRDLIKQYFANPEDDTVTLKSFNPRYQDYTVKAGDVNAMYRVCMAQPKPIKF